MDRVLFLVPPHLKFEDFMNPGPRVRMVRKNNKNFGYVLTDMPLGPLSLSSYLKKHFNVETRILDFNVTLARMPDFNYGSFTEFFHALLASDEWREFNPTVVGITALFTPSYYNLLDLGRVNRELFPHSLILSGGGVPTNMFREMFRDSTAFDALCFGEGEKPLLRLLQSLNRKAMLEQDGCWITRRKVEAGQVKQDFTQDFIFNLDEIPFYYDAVNTDDYSLNPALTSYSGVAKPKIANVHYMTSRGCPYCCTFCSSWTVNGKKMRYHSVERVDTDFAKLVSEFGVEAIVFQDDNFMGDSGVDTTRQQQILLLLKKYGLRAVFQNSLTLVKLKRPVLELMKDVGVDSLVLSVESGSDETLKLIKKPLRLEHSVQVARDCRELGIYTDCNILVGTPGETKKMIEDTRNFLPTIGANWFKVFITTPIVGSEMYEFASANGYLVGDPVNFDYSKANIETKDWTREWLWDTMFSMQMELNFVYNSDMRLGDYQTALIGLHNAISGRYNHAFAHYYASICYEKLGEQDKAHYHLEQAREAAKDPHWRKWLDRYNLLMEESVPVGT